MMEKFKKWCKEHIYVKSRDMADPIDKRKEDINDRDVGCDGEKGYEIGIKFNF